MKNGFDNIYDKDWKLWRYTFVFLGNWKHEEIFYFSLYGPLSIGINLTNMTYVNEYKLDKYGSCQCI